MPRNLQATALFEWQGRQHSRVLRLLQALEVRVKNSLRCKFA